MVKKSEKRLCYIIMPFSEHAGIDEEEWNSAYKDIFKPAIEGSGLKYRCERSEISAGAFTKEIVENMKNAHLVLADITGLNGNVMWELGVRHALSPRTVMVVREDAFDESMISDLKSYGVHTYKNNGSGITDFKKRIKETLKKIENDPDKSDNPVFDFLKIEDLILSSFERKNTINKLVAFLNELLENLRFIEGIKDGKFKVNKEFVVFKRMKTDAYLYLLSTNYHNFNETETKILHATILSIENLNSFLRVLDEAMSSSKSDDRKEEIIKGIKETAEDIETRFKVIIGFIKKEIDYLKQGKLRESEPTIVYFKSEHKQLIEK